MDVFDLLGGERSDISDWEEGDARDDHDDDHADNNDLDDDDHHQRHSERRREDGDAAKESEGRPLRGAEGRDAVVQGEEEDLDCERDGNTGEHLPSDADDDENELEEQVATGTSGLGGAGVAAGDVGDGDVALPATGDGDALNLFTINPVAKSDAKGYPRMLGLDCTVEDCAAAADGGDTPAGSASVASTPDAGNSAMANQDRGGAATLPPGTAWRARRVQLNFLRRNPQLDVIVLDDVLSQDECDTIVATVRVATPHNHLSHVRDRIACMRRRPSTYVCAAFHPRSMHSLATDNSGFVTFGPFPIVNELSRGRHLASRLRPQVAFRSGTPALVRARITGTRTPSRYLGDALQGAAPAGGGVERRETLSCC
jgi:hypothetical protein